MTDASWPDPAEADTNSPRLGWFLELDGAVALTTKLTNQVFWLPLHTDHVTDHVRRSAGASHRVAPQRHTSRQPTRIVVRGQCGSGGSSSLGQATLAAQLWTLIWHEWVDDASDPSDGLSRVGADCPLFKRNGWSDQEIVPTGIPRTLTMDVCIFRLELRKSEITPCIGMRTLCTEPIARLGHEH